MTKDLSVSVKQRVFDFMYDHPKTREDAEAFERDLERFARLAEEHKKREQYVKDNFCYIFPWERQRSKEDAWEAAFDDLQDEVAFLRRETLFTDGKISRALEHLERNTEGGLATAQAVIRKAKEILSEEYVEEYEDNTTD